ncbi:MAG: ABC transporter permease [Pseudomonadaceae bacterium]|nr:ABC transporter permease [Pseudomonadaceae bacterium]
MPNLPHITTLLIRFWYEYRQLWTSLFLRDFMDRLIYLLAFGFGMGGVMAASHGNSYMAFLVPGIASATGVFVVTMAMTYGVWERSSNTHLWQAWMATPLRLLEIMLAELIYASLRALPSVVILLLLAHFWLHALPSLTGALLAFPVLLLANLAMGAVAMCFTAHIRRPLHFAYVNTLWTTPMFLFGGTFFDMAHAPLPMQYLSQIFPLTHVIGIVRPLMLGQPLNLLNVATSLAILTALTVAGLAYAHHRFQRRLLD